MIIFGSGEGEEKKEESFENVADESEVINRNVPLSRDYTELAKLHLRKRY